MNNPNEIIGKIFGDMESDNENKTVILCGFRPSVEYIVNMIKNKRYIYEIF